MALMIIDECISCGLCVDECPNNAISEGNLFYEIDPDLCTECVGFHDKPQCVEVCPVEAIVPDQGHIENKEELLEKKKRIYGE
ncbi:MAG TPA: YfhL family 4Fe-4S dicluster ferredoxin [Bacteroidales bacterium]|nr:YfhL family 4Fe-4S dicluster ferredoxin [Bacteroidales bacterium]